MSMVRPGPDPETIAPAAHFRPIAEYGLLADCNAAALVDRDGSIRQYGLTACPARGVERAGSPTMVVG